MRLFFIALVGLMAIAAHAIAAELVPHGVYYWDENASGFGGFSGLSVADEGTVLWSASDGGTLLKANISRSDDGVIEAINSVWQDRFLDNFGEAVNGFTADAEALAIAADGTVFVAFESYARIAAFHPPDMRPRAENVWDRFRSSWGNTGFETLVILPDGRLMVVVEIPNGNEKGYRTFFGEDGVWKPGPTLPVDDGFQAVGGDFGPDGKFYLLERNVDLLYRFATRIRRFTYSQGAFESPETLLDTAFGALDNMEGISLWRDSSGRVIVSLISDDNFSILQNTIVVEYILKE